MSRQQAAASCLWIPEPGTRVYSSVRAACASKKDREEGGRDGGFTHDDARSREPERVHDTVDEFFGPFRYLIRVNIVGDFDVKNGDLICVKRAHGFAKMIGLNGCALPRVAKMIIAAC